MHTHLDETIIARRLRAAADEPSEVPYDWAEFQRRCGTRSKATALAGRDRSLAVAASVAAALLVAGVAIVRSNHRHVAAGTLTHTDRSGGEGRDKAGQVARSEARTRAIEGWLAALPHDQAVVRVGEHAAVLRLQDQIAELDDLMSAERLTGAQPSRLGALERQRAQLVSSLAQLRYTEMLVSASP
jgi:hypothetical protein